MDELTQEIVEYQKKGKFNNDLLSRLQSYIYFFPGKKIRNWEDEDSADFLLTLIPRIPLIIKRYNSQKKEFIDYLDSYLYWHVKTIRREKKKERQRDEFVISQIEQDERNSQYKGQEEFDILIDDRINQITKKRLLIIFLLNSHKWNDTLIQRFAEFLNCSTAFLYNKAAEMREKTERRREKNRKLEEYRNHLLKKRIELEEKLEYFPQETAPEYLMRRLNTNRKKLNRSYQKIDSYSIKPSHQDVADVLNIPKGTVNSGMYYLKKKIAKHEFKGDFI